MVDAVFFMRWRGAQPQERSLKLELCPRRQCINDKPDVICVCEGEVKFKEGAHRIL